MYRSAWRLDSDGTPCTGCAVGKRGGLTKYRLPRGLLLREELELDERLEEEEDRDLLLRGPMQKRVQLVPKML
jgi:hypothetical protein